MSKQVLTATQKYRICEDRVVTSILSNEVLSGDKVLQSVAGAGSLF